MGAIEVEVARWLEIVPQVLLLYDVCKAANRSLAYDVIGCVALFNW